MSDEVSKQFLRSSLLEPFLFHPIILMLEYTFLASGTYIVIQVERKVPLTKKSNWVEIRAKSYATI